MTDSNFCNVVGNISNYVNNETKSIIFPLRRGGISGEKFAWGARVIRRIIKDSKISGTCLIASINLSNSTKMRNSDYSFSFSIPHFHFRKYHLKTLPSENLNFLSL